MKKLKLVLLIGLIANFYYILTGNDFVSYLTRGRVLLNYKCTINKYPWIKRWRKYGWKGEGYS